MIITKPIKQVVKHVSKSMLKNDKNDNNNNNNNSKKGEAIKIKWVKGEEGLTKKNKKKNKCTQSEDLDQPRHLSSLIGVFPQGGGRYSNIFIHE